MMSLVSSNQMRRKFHPGLQSLKDYCGNAYNPSYTEWKEKSFSFSIKSFKEFCCTAVEFTLRVNSSRLSLFDSGFSHFVRFVVHEVEENALNVIVQRPMLAHSIALQSLEQVGTQAE